MIYVSHKADRRLFDYLSEKGPVKVLKDTDTVYPQVSAHPDIYLCRIGNEMLKAEASELGYSYPENCAFNGACTGKYLIGNMKILSPRLINSGQEQNMNLIHVNQGYAKCNIAVIDETSIITSDRGIYDSTKDALDVLLIEESTKEHPYIRLDGFPYGFIGGTCGRIGDEIIFNGSLSFHPDHERIRQFIEKRNIRIKEFSYPLEDIGSIII